jgi:hypothetical protein
MEVTPFRGGDLSRCPCERVDGAGRLPGYDCRIWVTLVGASIALQQHATAFVSVGSLADKASKAKIHLCPL